jgi:hypothetical protein
MFEFFTGLRHAFRILRRAPGFAALAITILATGIGASTVMYTLVQSVLLRELPFQEPERLVWMYNTRTERDRAPLSVPDLEDYRREASSLSGLAVFTNWTTNLTGIGMPERLDGVRVSGNFFELLGTSAALGRTLQPDDETRERRVAVLTHGLWQRGFGGDPDVVDTDISLNGATYTVVGVLPQRFLFPFREAEVAVPVTLQSDPRRADRGANFLRVVARLAPAVTLTQAKADLDAIAHRLQRLTSIPGVEAAGTVSLLPLGGLLSTADVAFPDRPAPPPDEVPQAHLRVATGEYFAAAGIQVLEGRAFDLHDTQDGQAVAIVSRSFAGRHWRGKSAVGQSVQIVQTSQSPQLTVVGVVNDVKQFTLDGPTTADLYVSLHQMPAFQAPLIASRMYWVIRGRGDTALTTQAIRSAVTQVEPNVAASSARTLGSLWLVSLGSRRANVRLLQAFGNVALVLCAIGVYGVTAFAARMRRRELAIRSALGASRGELTRSMMRRELVPVLLGLGVGSVVALIAAPHLFSGVFEMCPRDIRTYLQVAMMLLAVAVLATYIPVRRAGAANPSEALTP